MFSTFNYRPNNPFYTHKGQVIRRTATAVHNAVTYNSYDLPNLQKWLEMNNISINPNPGDAGLIDINIKRFTNNTINLTMSSEVDATIRNPLYQNNFNSSLPYLYSISPTGDPATQNYNFLTAVVITLVQRPDNIILIGSELLSIVYSQKSVPTPSQPSTSTVTYIDKLNFTNVATTDKYLAMLFNITTNSTLSNMQINSSADYIKTLKSLQFTFEDQTYEIPINVSVNQSYLTTAANGNGIYTNTIRGSHANILWNGDYIFSNLQPAEINILE